MSEELPLIQLKDKELERSRKAAERKKKQEEREKERNKKATAKKKASSSGVSGGPLDFLKSTNEWLEDMPTRIIEAYDNFIKDGENVAQSKVDKFCVWLAWKVNVAVERKRQVVLRILHDQYRTTVGGKVMQAANAIQSFCSDPLGALGTFASVLFGPVVVVFKWMAELAHQILKLAVNLAKIMAVLPPTPPSPQINYDKFKLQVKSISMAEVVADPNNLPPPEVVFPEPPRPFSKETFAETFEGSALLKSSQKKYILSEDDRKALLGFDTRSSLEVLQDETSVQNTSPNSIF